MVFKKLQHSAHNLGKLFLTKLTHVFFLQKQEEEASTFLKYALKISEAHSMELLQCIG